MAFRQKFFDQMILENFNEKFLQIQFINTLNKQKEDKQIITFISNKLFKQQKNKISYSIQFEIHDKIQKWRYINFLSDNHSMKALLAIKSEKYTDLNFFQKIKLQILTKRIVELCSFSLYQSNKLTVVFQSLQEEEKIESILNKIKQAKNDFLHFLKNDKTVSPLEIIRCLKTMGKVLTEQKKIFESIMDLQNLKRKNCEFSDIISLNQISEFYQYFYLDNNKSLIVKSKIANQIQWDRSINLQMDKSQCIVIQISLLNSFGLIQNLNKKRFKSVFPNNQVPINIQEMIPNYQKEAFFQSVHNFIEHKYQQQWKIRQVIQQENFIIPCTFDFSYEVTQNDIIINFLITVDQTQNQLIHFNSEGKIVSITKDLFYYLIEKSQNNFLQNILINEYLQSTMIQFHLDDIYNQVLLFQNLTVQGVFTQRIRTKWKYPLNYQKCSQKITSYYTSQTQQNSVRSFQNVLYSYSTKKIFNNFKQKVTLSQETDPKIQNIPIKLIKPNFFDQLSKIIVYSKNNYLEVEYDITFIPQDQQDQTQKAIFEICFVEIEGYTKILNKQEIILKELHQLDLFQQIKISKFDGVTCENLTQYKGIYKFIKISFILLLLLLIILISFSLTNIFSFDKNLTVFKYYYDYSIYPQTITFAYAAIYLNNWNRYCSLNNLFELSEFVETSRLGSLEFVNFVFSVNYNNDAMGCYLLSLEINMETIDVEYYLDNVHLTKQMNYFEFFDYARSNMDKMHRDNLVYYDTEQEDYSILKFNGLIRQNLIKIFVFCDIAMEQLVQIVLANINISTNQFYILQVISCTFSGVIITFQMILILHSWKWKDKFFQLLSHLNIILINDILIILDKLNQQSSIKSTSQNPTISYDSRKKSQIEDKKKLNHNIINYSYISLKSIILPMTYLIVIIGLTITVSLLHLEYFQKYEKSLELTFRFVKLKKVFDSSLILGELIKTEYLLNKSSINYFNQSEIIEQFFNYTDQLTTMVHDIYEDVESNDIFSDSTHQLIIDALSGNLCDKFSTFYHFCNFTTDLNYTEKDITYQYLAQGISGMIEKYQNLIQNEFSYERETLQYSQNSSELYQFLNTQIHQNIFVQYFYDMEYLVFTNFQYFYAETLYLGEQINYKLGLFYLYSGLITFMIFIIEFIVWSIQETKEISTLKMIVTLFPDQMLQNQTFQRLLIKTFSHLY